MTSVLATRPTNRSSIPGKGKRAFLYPMRPDRFSNPPGLVVNGFAGLFWGKTAET